MSNHQTFLSEASADVGASAHVSDAGSAVIPVHAQGDETGSFRAMRSTLLALADQASEEAGHVDHPLVVNFVNAIIKYLPTLPELNRNSDVANILKSVPNITERKKKESSIYSSGQELRALFELLPLGVVLTDMDGRCIEFNEAFQRITGCSSESLSRSNFWDLIPVRQQFGHAVESIAPGTRGHVGPYEKECINDEGQRLSLRLNSILVRGFNDKAYVWSIVEDITAQRKTEDELRIAAIAFETPDAIVVTDRNGAILRVNEAFTKITGYSATEIAGKNTRILNSGKHSDEFFREMWSTIDQDGHWSGEIWNKRKNGEIYPEWLTIASVKDTHGLVTYYVGTFIDISIRKKTEANNYQLAFYDHLTNLPNRRLLLDRLWQSQAASERNKLYSALLFLDLDNFKTINDTLGHATGDLLLVEAAKRISDTVRSADTVSRIGGDEFIILLEGIDANRGLAAEHAKLVGGKLLETLEKPYHLNGKEVNSPASIGVTVFRGREFGFDELLKQSDVAMYESKKAGRNALRFFDQDMQIALEKKVQMGFDLRAALKRKEFVVYFQKRVNKQNRVMGAEVLLRWQHPERGLVPPSDFIPLAEDTGLIVPIGLWVLEEACSQLRAWAARESTKHLSLSVNISAKEFKQDNFVEMVKSILGRTGANPYLLELEITESMLLDNIDSSILKMRTLKEIGLTFALDDFGTGYSSLTYLKRLPLDVLKIDQSFVRDIGKGENNEIIVQTIIQMGQNLGLDVIAEGVEELMQRVIIEHLGCDNYQGYLFGAPEPLEIFERSLE